MSRVNSPSLTATGRRSSGEAETDVAVIQVPALDPKLTQRPSIFIYKPFLSMSTALQYAPGRSIFSTNLVHFSTLFQYDHTLLLYQVVLLYQADSIDLGPTHHMQVPWLHPGVFLHPAQPVRGCHLQPVLTHQTAVNHGLSLPYQRAAGVGGAVAHGVQVRGGKGMCVCVLCSVCWVRRGVSVWFVVCLHHSCQQGLAHICSTIGCRLRMSRTAVMHGTMVVWCSHPDSTPAQ